MFQDIPLFTRRLFNPEQPLSCQAKTGILSDLFTRDWPRSKATQERRNDCIELMQIRATSAFPG